REQEAKDLGIRVGTLDKEVDRLRTPLETDAGAGTPMVFDEPEPWEEPVDGATLLDSLADTFTQHAKLPEHAPDALALWVLQTYSHEAAFICALLLLTSPQKRCGKTTVLALLKRLCYRSLPASNVTPAVVFRTVEKYAPTVLIDEADTFLKQSDELRGIINSGHSRDLAFVIRNVGEDHEPHRFSTWGPKAIAMIGNPAETIMDRSVVVKLTRKLPREKTARLRPKVTFADLTRQCARWAKDNLDQLTKAAPEMPANLNDRASDNWEFLVALADAAGGDWPERARKAAIALSGDDVIEDDSIKVQLLADIRDILAKWQQAYIPSRNLVEKLVALEDRPWCEFGRTGKPLTQRTLANLLHPFGITSGAHRRNNLVFKGYPVEKFQDACKRYIPSVSGKH
ncbi:MAG TPA: DUF3631 domain-containing protein, partial [Gammaproteobacteria bacterium]|nr:DUF3631 domain-containing protein [Gammaproteobacteria bacterium]